MPLRKSRPTEDAPKFGAAQVRELFVKASKAAKAAQYEHWLNTSFLAGEQWVFWNPVTRNLDEVPRDPERVRTQVNRMRPSSRTVMSKLVSRELAFEVPPTSADDAAIRGARTSESILDSVKREHDWEGVREDAFWSAWKGGTGAICVDWDAQAHGPIGMTAEGKSFGKGDTKETALSILDFVTQPGVRDAEKGYWWIKAIGLPPEEVQATYGLDEIPPADATGAMTPLQRKVLAAHEGRSEGDTEPSLTLVLTYYERPNPLCPEGRILTVVQEKVVETKPWYFPFKDRLNLALVRETREEGRALGSTILSTARPVQTALNQSWSSIVEHMKECGNARMYIPQSMWDMAEELSDAPGQFVPYQDGGERPEWSTPPGMPDWWIRQPDMLAQEIDDILGVHEASRGEAPKNVESGLGLSILIEQDATPIGRMTKEGALAWGRVASMVLALYEKFVKETRESVVRTPGQPPKSTRWTGKHLKGQTVALVPLDSVMPRSRAAQQQFAKDALQMGLIKSFAQYAKLADLPGSRDLLEAVSPDVAKARRENHKMSLGEPCVPEKFDDGPIHIEEHLTFMKSPEWDLMDEDARQIFLDHNQAHANLDAEKLGGQVSKAQVNPVLASAADPFGAPVLPVADTAAGAVPPPADPATDAAAGPEGGITDAAMGEVDQAAQTGDISALL